MRNHRPDLIVPIRDRRQGRRILTLRNFRNVLLVLFALFVIITIRSEMSGGEGEYGRLYQNEMPAPVAVQPFEVVPERQPAVADQVGADPLLMAPAVRAQQYLDTPASEPVAIAATIPEPAPAPVERRSGAVAIVGGADGVAIVQQTPSDLPKLKGGFGH